MVTVVIFGLQYLASVVTFLGAPASFRAALLPFHKWGGICLLFLTTTTLAMGALNRQWLTEILSSPATVYFASYNKLANAFVVLLILTAFAVSLVCHEATSKDTNASLSSQLVDPANVEAKGAGA